MDSLCQHNDHLFNALRFPIFFIEDHVIFRESFLELCIFFEIKPTNQPAKLRPHECTHFHESTKIEPHKNKWLLLI